MDVSVVTTMYFSRGYLEEFYQRTKKTIDELNLTYEFIFVDDGSPDDSLSVALKLLASDNCVKVIELSKNFGHQRAIMTGLQNASGDHIFLIDCDLEEDPELLRVFWNELSGKSDIDVIYGVQVKRKGGWFERISGKIFYQFVSMLSSVKYPADTLTARLMSRNYVDAVKRFSEKELDLWGIFAMTGYKQMELPATKKHKGSSTFTFRKKVKRAVEVITSLSHRPLYFTFIFGVISFFIALLNVMIILYEKFFLNQIVEGWASILASVWLIGGMMFLVLGIFGIYLSKMFLEIKNRPLTIIKRIYGKQ